MTNQSLIYQLGMQEKRYLFALHAGDEPIDKCPNCQTYLKGKEKKFALFILVQPRRPVVLGKTCRYCSKCRLIMLPRPSLEADLAAVLRNHDPALIQNDYIVLGTVNNATWAKGLMGDQLYEEIIANLSDFSGIVDLDFMDRRISEGKWFD